MGSALPADGMRPVTRADCRRFDGRANARILWRRGPSTAAAIRLVIKRNALFVSFPKRSAAVGDAPSYPGELLLVGLDLPKGGGFGVT